MSGGVVVEQVNEVITCPTSVKKAIVSSADVGDQGKATGLGIGDGGIDVVVT